MKERIVSFIKKKKIVVVLLGVLFVLAIIMMSTKPNKYDFENQVPKEFKELEARFEKKPVYIDYGIASTYYQVKKISSVREETIEYIGAFNKIYDVDTPIKQFIFDCMRWLPTLLEGTKVTISLTVIAVLAGMFFGIFLALGKMSGLPVISHICRAYIFFFRGTPLLMQLMFIYYSLPMINPEFAINDRFVCSCVAFGLNSAAYCSELIRAAIESIDKGQTEAAKALGFSYSQTMRKIIIPQTYKRLVPPFANEFIMILKDASLTSIIALQDLSKVTTSIQASTAKYTVFIPSMAIYLIITGVFSKIFEALEKKYSVYE